MRASPGEDDPSMARFSHGRRVPGLTDSTLGGVEPTLFRPFMNSLAAMPDFQMFGAAYRHQTRLLWDRL